MRRLTILLIFPFSALLSSCGSLVGPQTQNSPPRSVALDPMMAGKSFAEVTMRATILSAIRHPVTSARQGLAVFWHRPREIVVGNLPMQLFPQSTIPESPGSPEFERLLDEKDFPKEGLASLEWFVDGKEFFPELDRQIASAQKRINAQFYIFDNDDIAVAYADKLRALSKEIPVKIVYDDFGTATAHLSSPKTPAPPGFTPPNDIKKYLMEGSNVKVRRTLNPFLVADHTKLVVIDDRTAFLGGMNMGREYYSEWHDMMVRVEGPIVGRLSRVFERVWRMNGHFGDLALLTKLPKTIKPEAKGGEIPIRILRTQPGLGKKEIRDATLLAISGAKRRIFVENPYIANDEVILALRSAALRGVDVRVILPLEGDSAIMDAGNLVTARILIEAGAKLYRYPKMAHLKAMVCDDWAIVGSANLDILSMRINRELNISFSDKAEVEKLISRVFTPDFARSRRIPLSETNSNLATMAEIVADQL